MKRMLLGALCLGAVFGLQARTVAFWPFGEKGLQDASGNGNHLEADANVTIGETASMNGAQRLFSTVNALNLSGSQAVTVEFWTRFNAADNEGARFFLEFTEVTNDNKGGFYLDYGEAPGAVLGMYRVAGGNSGAEERPVVGIGDGQWHHVAFITSPSTPGEACSTLYIDKAHVYTHCHVYAIANASGYVDYPANKKLYVGSRNNSSHQFKGEIDNVRVSNVALSPEDFVNLDGSVPMPAPLAYWPFGSAGAADMSGNGHDLQLSSAGLSFTDGALSFDGTQSDSFTRLPVDLRTCTKGLTTEFWLRATPERTEPQIPFEFTYDANIYFSGSSGYYCDINSGNGSKMCFTARLEGDYQIDENRTTAVQDGAWHHVAYVLDPSVKNSDTCRFYLDGVLQAQSTSHAGTNLLGLAKEHLYLGGRSGRNCRFTGEIDDVRLTPDVLSVAQFMRTRTDENAEVLGHWTFNRGAETANARGTATLAATGVAYENGAAVLDGTGTLATSALEPAGAVTAECFFTVDGTWHHLVKVYGDGVGSGPTAVKVDGEDAASDLLAFSAGVLRIAGAGFAGRVDDVRVTAGVLSGSGLLAARTDDTPVELAHWSFDSLVDPGLDPVGGMFLNNVSKIGGDCDVFERALRIYHGAGVRTVRPLHLSHWPALTVEWFGRATRTDGLMLEVGSNYNAQPGAFAASMSMVVDGAVGAGIRTGNGYNIRSMPEGSSMLDGAWHHYAFVMDRSGGSLQTAFYVDGVAQANYVNAEKKWDYTSTADVPFVDECLILGARYAASTSYTGYGSYVGDIDELRIVNGALAPPAMMTAQDRARQDAVTVAHWRFDGETPLADRSGNGYDLTGTATVSDGAAVFSGTTALQTAKPLALSGFRQVTVEAVYQVDNYEDTAILFETGTAYGDNGGSISCYYNGAGDFYGRIDACTRALVWTTDNTWLRDARWHHVALQMDMDIGNQSRIRYWIDGTPAGAWTRIYTPSRVAADTLLGDLVLHLGSRNGNQFFMKGRMKEVRVTGGLVPVDRFLERPVPPVDEEGVVAYWPFSRSADWRNDEGGHGYELASTGTGVQQSSKNGCVSFAANHDALTTSTRIDFGTMEQFTLEAFVRPTGTSSLGVLGTCPWDAGRTSRTPGLIFATAGDAEGGVDLRAGVTLGAFRNKEGKYVANSVDAGAGTYDAKDRWHHVALVVDRTAGANGRIAYYYDRGLVKSWDLTARPDFKTVQLSVGGLTGDLAASRFVGDIDDVRVTAAALEPAQMLQRRSAGLGMMFIVR